MGEGGERGAEGRARGERQGDSSNIDGRGERQRGREERV